ncbi:hypothetical protein EMCRGX_G011192 [Ephydatia muelleri]
MASDAVEEEDMPELESLSSSESIDEDAEDDDERETVSSFPSDVRLVDQLSDASDATNSQIAVQWLCRDWSAIEKQMHIISLYTLSPFLFGCSYQSEKWMRWLCQVQLLKSDKHFTTGLLDQRARSVVDIFEHAYGRMMDWMREGWPPNGAHPVGVTYMLDLFQEVRDCREVWDAIDKAKKNVWFAEVIQSSGEDFSDMYGGGTMFTRQSNLLITAYLYILTNTAECLHWCMEKKEQDITTPLGRFTHHYDRQVDGLHVKQNEGMVYFSCKNYDMAVERYDYCVQKYPFSSNIFLQRCLSFLELKKSMEAASDGLRAHHLDPDSQTVINVYARALREAGEFDKAMMVKTRFEMKLRARKSSGTSLAGTQVSISDRGRRIEEVPMEFGGDQSGFEFNGSLCITDCGASLESILYVLTTLSHPQAVNAELDMAIQSDNSHSVEATRSDTGHSKGPTKGGNSNSSVHGGTVPNVEDKRVSKKVSSVEDKRVPKRVPSVEDKRAPSVDYKRVPSVEDKRVPSVEDKRVPSVEDKRAPSVDFKRVPSVEDKRVPSAEDERAPATEVLPCCGSQGECRVAQGKAVFSLDNEKTSVEIKPAAMVTANVCVQTECSTADKGVATEPLPPVETFKEKYEGLVVEKKSLCAKLDDSEDKRVQLHKEHKRELERVQKKVRQEVQDENNAKIMSLEAQLLDERAREQQGKKEQTEQIKALKLEIKAHKEKADRCKKDLNRKEHELETRLGQFQADMDKGYTDKKRMEERMRAMMDSNQKALVRATSAEVELVTLKRDITLKGLENDLVRIETISQNMVSTGEYHQQLTSFKEKFKAALSAYQTAIDEVIKQLKMGRELLTLTVPEPCMPTAPIPPLSASMQHMRSMLMPLMPQHQNVMPQAVSRLLPQGTVPPVAPLLGTSQGVLQGPSHQGLVQQVPPLGILQTVPHGLPQVLLQSVAQGSSKSMPQGSPQGIAQGIPQGVAQSVPQSLPQGVPQGLIQQSLRATQGPSISRGLSQGMPQQGLSQGMPQQGLSQVMPQQGLSQGMPQQGLSQGMSQQGLSQGMPQQGLSQVMPQQGLSQVMPQQGLSQVMPQQGLSQVMPQQGLSQGMPQQGLSQGMHQQGLSQVMPQQGLSQGMPQQGLSQGMPQQGLSQGMHQQGLLQGISQQGLLQGISQNMSHDLLQGIPNGMPFGTNPAYSSLSSMMPLLANMSSSLVPPLVMPNGYTSAPHPSD